MWDAQRKESPCWEFYAIQRETNCIDEIADLLQTNDSRHALKLLKTIDETCFHLLGPKLYEKNPNICHEAVAGEGIFELRKGNIRLYWFYGNGRRVVICSMVIVKRVQKTPAAVANKLVEYKKAYFKAVRENTLIYRKQEN